MPGQHINNDGIDPHEWHLLTQGPIRISGRWYGACRCGFAIHGISREDIYMKAQAHVDNNQPPDGAA